MSMIKADVRRTGLMGGDLGFAAAVCSSGSFARSTGTGEVNNPQVGDTWQVTISNAAPSAPVTLQLQTQQGISQQVVGYTDGAGQFNQNGQFTQDQQGPQTRVYICNGRVVGSWPLVVRPTSDLKNIPPAALLTPMPSIIPVKPGRVSSSQMGVKCQVDSFVNANPVAGILIALGIGWMLRGKR